DDLVSELDKKIKEEETETRIEANRKTVNFYGHDPVDFNNLFSSSHNYDVKIKILETLENVLSDQQNRIFYVRNGKYVNKEEKIDLKYAIFDYRVLIDDTIKTITDNIDTESNIVKKDELESIVISIGKMLIVKFQ
ncbi:MAG: hypothetical protein MHPSP_002210, partial [Paramarteilia canceri]